VRLSELLTAVGPRTLRADTAELDPVVTEVVLDDGRTMFGPHQVVLAVRPGRETELVEECRAAGCDVVVVADDVADDLADATLGESGCGPLVARADTGWTQLFVLVAAMLLASHDEACEDDPAAPGSVHSLADAIAVMMGASVVLYDRAHRVVAYSVQGHPIDDVRRDTILGRRTPERWIQRFTIDRTAYQTYAELGSVVRVADYPGLRPRLRIAIHSGAQVLGEISVAQGDSPFADDADETLQRAARMAVPAMLRHCKACDVDDLNRTRAVRTLLTMGVSPSPQHPAAIPFVKADHIALLALRTANSPRDTAESHRIVDERLVHFLTLHVRALSPEAQVVHLKDTSYALLPDLPDASRALGSLAKVLLRQMQCIKIQADIALAGEVEAVGHLPSAKRLADDLLEVGAQSGEPQRIMIPEQHWAQLVLLASARSISASCPPCAPLARLRRFDADNRTDLVETLRVYLASLGSVSTAAARLYLHGNTMRHRLARIGEISGIDLDDPNQRLAIGLMLATPEQSGGA
jgi:hypothetical protein